ncbi:EthD family reductase [Chloroflexota bacterium]
MVKLVSLFSLKPSVDFEEFERHYREVHIPLSSKLPGQRKYVTSRVRPSKKRQMPFYRMAENFFDDIDAVRRMLASEEAEAAANDEPFHNMVQDFIQFFCEEEEIPL